MDKYHWFCFRKVPIILKWLNAQPPWGTLITRLIKGKIVFGIP